MDIKLLKDFAKKENTTSYNLKKKQKTNLYEKHQDKINQALNKLKWHLDFFNKEAMNGFRDLQSGEKMRVLESRIEQAKDYFLDNAGVYEHEFLDYMRVIEDKVIEIYKPFMDDFREFARFLNQIDKKRRVKIKDYDPDFDCLDLFSQHPSPQ